MKYIDILDYKYNCQHNNIRQFLKGAMTTIASAACAVTYMSKTPEREDGFIQYRGFRQRSQPLPEAP